MPGGKGFATVRAGALLLLVAAGFGLSLRWHLAAAELPSRITDREFWGLVSSMSEPDGFFQSDNFLSNEIVYQHVIPPLKSIAAPGGIYVGVGPEQNFTYIVALEPKLAFIVDIRRQNLVEHLLYKALFEISGTRVDFLSHLFARQLTEGQSDHPTVNALFAALIKTEPSEQLFKADLAAVRHCLITRHGFALTNDDDRQLEYVYRTFFQAGPRIGYGYTLVTGNVVARRGAPVAPSYAELMTTTDGLGERRSYLASEESFRFVKQLEAENRIVPLVGDFAGPKTIRAVGDYVRDRDATVTVFYASNVEQYLFQQGDDWKKFLANVKTLPIDSNSTLIRSVPAAILNLSRQARRWSVTTLIGPIMELVKAFDEDRIHTYEDVIILSN